MSGSVMFSIGEALIDMIPTRSGCEFAEVPSFMPRIGGAPANVCGAFARLGGQAALLTKLGNDPLASLPGLSAEALTEYLRLSNAFCGASVQAHGAIDSYPTSL